MDQKSQPAQPQPAENTPRKPTRSTGEMMPLLLHNAPSAFRARGFSLERLRTDYGITRRQALEMVLAGLILSDDRRPDQQRPFLLKRSA